MVEITEIDRDEALRYLCCHDENNIGETAGKYLDECESRLLGVISPKFLYRYFPLSFKDGVPVISGCTLTLNGSDIAAHLEGCSGVIVMCATVGGGADRLIRRLQVEDMAKAVIADAFAGAAVEQVCAKALSYSGKPSYKSIKNLLVATKDAPDTESESTQVEKPHGITRGARYYGGKQS